MPLSAAEKGQKVGLTKSVSGEPMERRQLGWISNATGNLGTDPA